MQTSQTTRAKSAAVHDEQILVVKRNFLFADIPAWHGIKKVDFSTYLRIIEDKKEFQPRSLMENDPTYKQIIPYLVFAHNNRYFLMQRHKKASEKRLQSKFSLGIGGHIRKEDMTHGRSIFDWAKREFHEEIDYQGDLTITPLGILNDDSNEVGKVHIGFVLLLQGTSDKIDIKSELASGQLVTIQQCVQQAHSMETWSQIILAHLT